MNIFLKILTVLAALAILWMTFGYVKKHPELFSKPNLERSFFVLGILALLLIGLVFGLVLLVR